MRHMHAFSIFITCVISIITVNKKKNLIMMYTIAKRIFF